MAGRHLLKKPFVIFPAKDMPSPVDVSQLCLTSLASRAGSDWWVVGLVLLAAVAVAALIGWLRRVVWEHGWNTNPPPHSVTTQVWCALASTAVVAAVLTGWAFRSAPLALESALVEIRSELFPDARRNVSDGGWRRATFRKVGDEIQARGLENFAGKPTSAQGGTEVPVTERETAKLVAERYAQAFDERFRTGQFDHGAAPWGGWLNSKAAAGDSAVASVPPTGVITADVAQNALLRGALDRRLEEVSSSLRAEVRRVSAGGFWFVWALAILLQVIAFAVTGRAAFRDLRLDF